MPINNKLWHAKVGLFNNRLNKRNKTIFPLYLSNDLSKRLMKRYEFFSEVLMNILQLHNNPIYQTTSTAKNVVKQTASRTVNFDNIFSTLFSRME